jgi:hypothetical protein
MTNTTGLILTAGSGVLVARMLAWLANEEAVEAVTLILRGSSDGSVPNIFDFRAELTRGGCLTRVR